MSYLMEEEINSQAEIIQNLIDRYIVNYCFLLDLPLEIKRIIIIASGSSYNAGLFGKYFFENIANVECSVEYSAEFSNSKFTNYNRDTLYVFISQSGNSVDTVLSMSKVAQRGCRTLCITNNVNSETYKMADYKFSIEAGEEFAIAATKTFSASIMMLWILACKIAQNKHINVSEETKNVYTIPASIRDTIENVENIDSAVKLISKQDEFSICGYGYNYPLSRETALKIKETSYINTSSYPLGEFIHGHFAILNKSKVFMTFLEEDCEKFELEILNKIFSTYKAKSIIVSDSWDDFGCDCLIKIPKCQSKIATIMSMIVTIQILALKVAIKLKRNVDKPKGLSKIVK